MRTNFATGQSLKENEATRQGKAQTGRQGKVHGLRAKGMVAFVLAFMFMLSAVLTGCGAGGSGGSSSASANSEESEKKTKFKNIAYADGAENLLDVTIPSSGDGPYPTVIFVHGGAWCSLGREYGIFETMFKQLRKAGYAVAYVDYTLNTVDKTEDGVTYATESHFPQMLYDVKCAIRYLRANAETYNLDPDKFFLLGESAGGHLSLLSAATQGNPDFEDLSMGYSDVSSEVQAVLAFFSPALYDYEEAETNDFLRYLYGLEYDETDWQNASPYYQFTSAMPDVFLSHGRNDQLVFFVNSEKNEERLKELIGEDHVTTLYMDEAAHGDKTVYNGDPVVEAVLSFLDAHK